MIIKDFYAYLQNSGGISTDSIFPHVLPVDHEGDAILFKLDATSFDETFDGEEPLKTSLIELVILSDRFINCVSLSEELETLIKNFKGEFVPGSHNIQRTIFSNQLTAFDGAAELFAIVTNIQFTYT